MGHLELEGKTVIVVDDGLATGASMLAAVEAFKERGIDRIVAAVPVGPPDVCARLSRQVDQLVCPIMPERFFAVGPWYQNFTQTSDAEVVRSLDRVAAETKEETATP